MSLERQFQTAFDNPVLVFFTPWIKADPTSMQDISDFIEDHQFPSKMFSSQELDRRRKNLCGHHPTLDMDDSKLRSIYPPPDKLYAEIKISNEDGKSRDSTSSTNAKKNISYHTYFCKGYETTGMSNQNHDTLSRVS